MNSNQPAFGFPKPPQGGAGFGYKTGMNADRQAINTGHATGRLNKESAFTPKFGSPTGRQGAADLVKSQQVNDQSQLRRGIETANAQSGLENQVSRSELMQAGLSNQAKIYADMTSRATDQISLAAQLQQAMIRNRAALMTALIGEAGA